VIPGSTDGVLSGAGERLVPFEHELDAAVRVCVGVTRCF
jgi:hypothetical protein